MAPVPPPLKNNQLIESAYPASTNCNRLTQSVVCPTTKCCASGCSGYGAGRDSPGVGGPAANSIALVRFVSIRHSSLLPPVYYTFAASSS